MTSTVDSRKSDLSVRPGGRARDTQVATAASYQLMASYLLWDLRDLLGEGRASSGWRARVGDLLELLRAADSGGRPIYPPPPDLAKTGGIRAERTRRLANLPRDEDLFDLVAVLTRKAGKPSEQILSWINSATVALERMLAGEGEVANEQDRTFLSDEVEPFLRRLQRIDEFDEYRPPLRKNLVRR